MENQSPIDQARKRLTRARRELQVACAEHGLAHDALDRHLPARVRTGDVAWALGQGAVVEQKLEAITEEMLAIFHLLEAEADA